MKKLVYISSDWYFDTDMTILHKLAEVYDLYWFVYSHKEKPRVKEDILRSYANLYKINCSILQSKNKHLSPFRIFEFCRLAQIIKKVNPDLIVKIEPDFYFNVALKMFLNNIPVVHCLHDVEVHSGTHNSRIRQWSIDLTVKANKNFIVYSNFQKRIFQSRFPEKKTEVINMSVKDYGNSLIRLGLLKDEIRLLFFGRIEYHKGLDLLISALEEFECVHPSCGITLTICGTGSFWEECKKKVRTNRLYNLQIRFIKESEIADLMCSHHYLALPYRDTTQSGPVMIAANYGIPLFAKRHESFAEIYPDRSAVFYSSISEGLNRIFLMNQEEYNSMKLECHKIKEDFSENNIARKYLNYFEDIVKH